MRTFLYQFGKFQYFQTGNLQLQNWQHWRNACLISPGRERREGKSSTGCYNDNIPYVKVFQRSTGQSAKNHVNSLHQYKNPRYDHKNHFYSVLLRLSPSPAPPLSQNKTKKKSFWPSGTSKSKLSIQSECSVSSVGSVIVKTGVCLLFLPSFFMGGGESLVQSD